MKKSQSIKCRFIDDDNRQTKRKQFNRCKSRVPMCVVYLHNHTSALAVFEYSHRAQRSISRAKISLGKFKLNICRPETRDEKYKFLEKSHRQFEWWITFEAIHFCLRLLFLLSFDRHNSLSYVCRSVGERVVMVVGSRQQVKVYRPAMHFVFISALCSSIYCYRLLCGDACVRAQVYYANKAHAFDWLRSFCPSSGNSRREWSRNCKHSHTY